MITVLMCVKDGEKYIKETIDSVLSQTYTNFEFIIIVNCTTDNTLEILKKYNDKRIKIYETKIGQLCFNLNYGLNLAKGEYIARIDADDICVKNRLEKQLKYIEKNNIDVLGGAIEYIDSEGKSIKILNYPKKNNEIRKKILYKSVIAHPSVMFKKEVVLKIGGYLGGKVSEDYDLWIRLMRDPNIKFENMSDTLIKYRIHSNQARGNKLAYGEIAGYFLREFVLLKKIRFIFATIIYLIKGLIK